MSQDPTTQHPFRRPSEDPAEAPANRTPRIVALVHEKGGTGKTTTACNMAVWAAWALQRQQALVVDLDAQGSASYALAAEPASSPAGTYDALTGSEALLTLAVPGRIPNLDVVPATARLRMAELDAALRQLGHETLRETLLAAGRRYRLILVDCPPGLGLLATLAIAAADLVILPTPPRRFAEEALHHTLSHLSLARGADSRGVRVLLTQVDAEDPENQDVMTRLRREVGPVLWPFHVPLDRVASEAALVGMPETLYAPESAVAQGYRRVTQAALDHLSMGVKVPEKGGEQVVAARPVATERPPARRSSWGGAVLLALGSALLGAALLALAWWGLR